MFAYRISIDNNEINEYKHNKVYYENKPIFNINNNSLYKVNTFKSNNINSKYFFYFPQDAFEIAKIVLKINKSVKNVYILEYMLNKDEISDKFGFGNYRNLVRKKYLPENKVYKIRPYENSTYPVLELKMNKKNTINITNNYFNIDINSGIPNELNRLQKLREYILYKIYLEKVMDDFNINYPHGNDGLMIITNDNKNIKKLYLPKKYQNILC